MILQFRKLTEKTKKKIKEKTKKNKQKKTGEKNYE